MFSNNPNLNYSAPGLRPNDVVSGRGYESTAYFHPGTVCFRNLIKEFKAEYISCRKADKPAIAQRIVKTIMSKNPPGRFMKKDKESGIWFDIGYRHALTKTRQALREGAPMFAKRLKSQQGLLPKFMGNKQQLHLQLQKNSPSLTNSKQLGEKIEATDVNLLQGKSMNELGVDEQNRLNQISQDIVSTCCVFCIIFF